MCRTAKGSVNRRQTTDLYTEEIDGLYKAHQLDRIGIGPNMPTEPPSEPLTRESLKSVLAHTLSIEPDMIEDNESLF